MKTEEALEVVEIIELILDSHANAGKAVPAKPLVRLIRDLRTILLSDRITSSHAEKRISASTEWEEEITAPLNSGSSYEKRAENLSAQSVEEDTTLQSKSRVKLSPGEMRGRVRELVDLISDDSLEHSVP